MHPHFACPRVLRCAIACAIASVLSIGSTRAGDWPTIGGSNARHGQSSETGPAGADVLWQGSVSALFGGPNFIEGDRLTTMRFQTISVTPIVTYDLFTGEPLWSVDFPGTNSRSVPRGMKDGKVYATNFQETGNDTLYALDVETGATIWKSAVFCERGIIWSAVFAPDGDLIVPSTSNHISRVDSNDGSEVWEINRIIPNTGAEALALFGNTLYGFEGTITTPKILTAWDVATGVKKYSTGTLPGDGDQEVPHTIGPDGTIYVKRDGGLLYAFTDTGSALVEKWHASLGVVSYAGQYGVGIDGSVYVPDGTGLVRLDPDTGAILDTSVALVSGSTLNPRFAIGSDGTLYVGNGGGTDGRLYALAPDLEVLWSAPVPGMVYGGPALGSTGALVVAGNGTRLDVYRSGTVAVDPHHGTGQSGLALRVSPNPLRSDASVSFHLDAPSSVRLSVMDAGGRTVDGWSGRTLPAGEHTLDWRNVADAGADLGNGVLFLRLEAGSRTETVKVIRVR